MSVKNKSLEKLKIAEKMEDDFKKRIAKEYSVVLKELTKELSSIIAKMPDGKLTNTEMFKHGRLPKLIKTLTKELKTIQSTKPAVLQSYLKDQYNFNYSYTAFISESEYQIKMNFVQPSKVRVEKAISSPFNKISLENNRAQVIDKVRSAVAQSIVKGEGINGVASRVKKALENNANNAFTIARTETTRVMAKADQDSMEHANNIIPLEKEWVTTVDGKERDSHEALNGQVVDVDKPFVIPPGEDNSGAEAMGPGDFGIAEEDINCRCVVITRIKGFKNEKEFRKVRGVDGKNKIIESKNFDKWKKERYN